jgi:MFS family permease
LNASTFQIGLLSSMPAITGLILALPMGQWLQRQENIVKYFSIARLLVIASYAITGLISFMVPEQYLVNSVLVVWAVATIPQTIVAITFSVVMNAVAGPSYRFDLMSRRWSMLGIATSVAVIGIGQLLDSVAFPLNYRIMFIAMSLGGLISYYFSSHISIPSTIPPKLEFKKSTRQQLTETKDLVFSQKPFVSFILKRFVYLTGTALAAPLIPLYLVRVVHATDGWISFINTASTAILVIGYLVWTNQSRKIGTHKVLLLTTLGTVIYPFLLAFVLSPWQIVMLAGINGIFQAGVDLVFFDELMKTVPIEYSATFVSIAQGVQFLSSIVAPLAGTAISDAYGLALGLIVSALFRLAGFLMFFLDRKPKPQPVTEEIEPRP